MKKQFFTAAVTAIIMSGIFVLYYNATPQPTWEKNLHAVEEVRRQLYDSDGAKLGEVQTFKRSIYRKQLVFNDKSKLEATNSNPLAE